MNDDEPTPNRSTSSDLDLEVARVLEAYLADVEAGRTVDPQQLLAKNSGDSRPPGGLPRRPSFRPARGRRSAASRRIGLDR